MKRLVIGSLALALAGGLAPWNGATAAPAPQHRLDVAIKLPGGTWTGVGDYGRPGTQQVVGVLRHAPGRAVAVVRITNTGTADTALEIWASSIRETFYGGAHWPEQDRLAPGESVVFRYVAHRGSADDGQTMPVDISVRRGQRTFDAVRFLLAAK